MNEQVLFESLYPGFFQGAGIAELPEEAVFTELVMDLRKDRPRDLPFDAPEGLFFDRYHGKTDTLREAVGQVAEDWVQYFEENTPVLCAFDRDRIASFCIRKMDSIFSESAFRI